MQKKLEIEEIRNKKETNQKTQSANFCIRRSPHPVHKKLNNIVLFWSRFTHDNGLDFMSTPCGHRFAFFARVCPHENFMRTRFCFFGLNLSSWILHADIVLLFWLEFVLMEPSCGHDFAFLA